MVNARRLAGLLVAIAAGCSPEWLDDPAQIAAPPDHRGHSPIRRRPDPVKTIALAAVVADAAGPAAPPVEWAFCRWPKPLAENGPVHPACAASGDCRMPGCPWDHPRRPSPRPSRRMPAACLVPRRHRGWAPVPQPGRAIPIRPGATTSPSARPASGPRCSPRCASLQPGQRPAGGGGRSTPALPPESQPRSSGNPRPGRRRPGAAGGASGRPAHHAGGAMDARVGETLPGV